MLAVDVAIVAAARRAANKNFLMDTRPPFSCFSLIDCSRTVGTILARSREN